MTDCVCSLSHQTQGSDQPAWWPCTGPSPRPLKSSARPTEKFCPCWAEVSQASGRCLPWALSQTPGKTHGLAGLKLGSGQMPQPGVSVTRDLCPASGPLAWSFIHDCCSESRYPPCFHSYIHPLPLPLPLSQVKSLGSPRKPSPGEIPLGVPSIHIINKARNLSAQDEEEVSHWSDFSYHCIWPHDSPI